MVNQRLHELAMKATVNESTESSGAAATELTSDKQQTTLVHDEITTNRQELASQAAISAAIQQELVSQAAISAALRADISALRQLICE